MTKPNGLTRIRHASKQCLPLEATDAAYIAGFVDGEGCIYANIRTSGSASGTVRAGLTVANTSGNVLYWMATTTGLGAVYWQEIPGGWGKLRCGTWRVSFHEAATLCEQLIPYLQVKRPEAEGLIELSAIKMLKENFGKTPERAREIVGAICDAKRAQRDTDRETRR